MNEPGTRRTGPTQPRTTSLTVGNVGDEPSLGEPVLVMEAVPEAEPAATTLDGTAGGVLRAGVLLTDLRASEIRLQVVPDQEPLTLSGRLLTVHVGFSLTPTCEANCDGSTSAPVLDSADFTCFLRRYAAGDEAANCDGSTAVPVLNAADFSCFLQRFAAGCP